MMRFLPLRVLLAAAVLALVGAAPARPQTQTFRSGASLVRVDVYPTAGGHPVTDLRAADFEVLEDDVPQKIEAFEQVSIQPAAATQTASAPEPVPAGQLAANADGKSRIFVLFLDTYFTDLGGSRRTRYAIANFLDRLVGPDDLIGVMTPDMAASDVTLVHRTKSIDDMLSKYWFWGDRDNEAVDPIEEQYLSCYPRDMVDRDTGSADKYAGVADEMIQRRREKRVMDALSDLTKHLRTVSDARKAVVTVTDGWVLFKPNLEMTERGRYRQPRAGVGPDGRLTSNAGAAADGSSSQRCEQDRVSLALVDDKGTYDALIDTANRSNVSFYPVSVDGLRSFDHNMGLGPREALAGERQAADPMPTPSEIGPMRLATDSAVRGKRVDTLQSLAVNTDGLAIAAASDVESGLHRIVDDLSSYYLLGYSSTNPLPDGKFRKIQVRVLRSGVDVRARKGYRAPTRDDLLRPDATSPTARAPKSPVEAAMAELKADRAGTPLRVGAAYAPLGPADSGGDRVHVWAMAEIDPVIARRGEWIGGGTVELSVTARNGETLARKSVTFGGGEHSASIDLGEVTAVAGEAVVHATARAAGGGRENYAEALHLDSLGAPGRPLIYRRGLETAQRYVPTAGKDFERTDRLRVDLPMGAPSVSPAAELLDRAGKAMAIPVTVTARAADGLNWVTADVSLAPLAAGTYFVRVKPDGAHPEANVVAGFRVVP